MNLKQFAFSCLLLTLSAGFMGCNVEEVTVHEEGETLVTDLTTELTTELKVTEADSDQLAATVAEHRGKIVIVDFWATWCHTCMELMPHTAELQQQHSDDIVLITMSLDDADKRPLAEKFLQRLPGNAIHLISSVGGGPKSLEEYNLEYGPPHYFFYNREGERVKVLDSDPEHLATEEAIEAAVNEMLALPK